MIVSYAELISFRHKSVYGVVDPAFLCLYHFYKSHDAADVYEIDIPENESAFTQNEINIFRSYGLRFLGYEVDLQQDKQFQFIIIPESMMNSSSLELYAKKICVEGLHNGYCLIEKDYTDVASDTFKQDKQLVESIFPGSYVINTCKAFKRNKYENTTANSLNKYKKNHSTGNPYHLEDVSALFTDFNQLERVDIYIRKANEVIARVLDMNLDEDTIIYVNDSIQGNALSAYMAIGAYLLLRYGIKCHINPGNYGEFYSLVDKAKSNTYMFLDDYLKTIREFADFSISCRGGHCYLWVKDYSLLGNKAWRDKYDVKLTIFRAGVDTKTWSLVEEFSNHSLVVPLRNINSIKRFRDLSDIGSSDFDAAKCAMEKLNALFKNITDNLIDLKVLANDTFITINNVLLYEQGGVNYVAYVSKISGEIPFIVYPLIKGYLPFKTSLSINELHGLHDIALFYDANLWMKQIKAKNPKLGSKMQYYDENTLKGIILSGFRQYNTPIRQDAGLTLAEIGMWSHQTGGFRDNFSKAFATLFNKKDLLKLKMFSIFGGKHPQIATALIITDELWRYDNC